MRIPRIAAAHPKSRWGDLCVYPRSTNFNEYSAVGNWARDLNNTSPSGVYVVTGDPGTGKTFHLLLHGFLWEARSFQMLTLSQTKSNRYAFYADLRDVDIDDVREQWELAKSDECLWILDDIHPDEHQLFRELVEAFVDDKMSESSHRLVGAVWNVPEGLPADVRLINFKLNPELVSHAFKAKALPFTQAQIASCAASQAGLRVLLWYGELHRNESSHTTFPTAQIGRIWAKMEVDQQPHLTADAKSLFALLSALQILNMGIPRRAEASWFPSLQLLESSGLIRLRLDVWRVDDDEKAIAWLDHRLRQCLHRSLAQFFVEQLLPCFDELLEDDRFSLRMLKALYRLPASELTRLFHVSSAPRGAEDLLLLSFRDEITAQRFYDNAITLPLPRVSNVLRFLFELGVPVRDVASKLLLDQEAAVLAQAIAGDIAAWIGGLRISRVCQNDTAGRQFIGLIQNDSLLQALRDADFDTKCEGIRYVREICGPVDALPIVKKLAQSLAANLSRFAGTTFWGKCKLLTLNELQMVLPYISVEKLGESCLMDPPDARRTFDALQGNQRKQEIWNLFKSAVHNASLTTARKWRQPYQVLEWLKLLARTEEQRLADNPVALQFVRHALQSSNGAIIQTLSVLANLRFRKTALRNVISSELRRTLKEKLPPLSERLFGLAELDRKGAEIIGNWIFETTFPDASNPGDLFWMMMNGLGALWSVQSRALIESANKVYEVWNDVLVTAGSDYEKILSLAGISSFITGRAPPPFRLTDWPPNFTPESAPATACQFYALCRSEYKEWITWIGNYITGSSENELLRGKLRKLSRYSAPWFQVLARIVTEAIIPIRADPYFSELLGLLKTSNIYKIPKY